MFDEETIRKLAILFSAAFIGLTLWVVIVIVTRSRLCAVASSIAVIAGMIWIDRKLFSGD